MGLVLDITDALERCNFLVFRNAPLANYADVICVNKQTKEL
jgi:hypothetical protein